MEEGEVEEEDSWEEMHSLRGSNTDGRENLTYPHHAQHHECQELVTSVEFNQEEDHANHYRDEY